MMHKDKDAWVRREWSVKQHGQADYACFFPSVLFTIEHLLHWPNAALLYIYMNYLVAIISWTYDNLAW